VGRSIKKKKIERGLKKSGWTPPQGGKSILGGRGGKGSTGEITRLVDPLALERGRKRSIKEEPTAYRGGKRETNTYVGLPGGM